MAPDNGAINAALIGLQVRPFRKQWHSQPIESLSAYLPYLLDMVDAHVYVCVCVGDMLDLIISNKITDFSVSLCVFITNRQYGEN